MAGDNAKIYVNARAIIERGADDTAEILLQTRTSLGNRMAPSYPVDRSNHLSRC